MNADNSENLEGLGSNILRFESKRLTIDPYNLYAAVNPRDLSDLQGMEIVPEIVATGGKLIEPPIVWLPTDSEGNPDYENPIWDKLYHPHDNKPVALSIEERKKARILAQGHRRTFGVIEIASNTAKYADSDVAQKELKENTKRIDVVEVKCSEAEIRNIAMDFEKRANLHSWNTVKIVLDLLRKGLTYQAIALQMPKSLFVAFIKGNGEAMYNKLLKTAGNDGSKRVKMIKSKLKNPLDTHVQSGHIFSPIPDENGDSVGMAEQLLLWFRYKENGLEDKSGRVDKLVLDMKYENVRNLRTVYTKTHQEEGWSPVSRVEIVSGKPKESPEVSFKPSPNEITSGEYLVVEGGNATFRQAVLALMVLYIRPEEGEKEKPPSKNERQAIKEKSEAGLSTALCAYHENKSIAAYPGKFLDTSMNRAQWENWALIQEAVQARLIGLENELQSHDVKELVRALVNSLAPKTAADRVENSIRTLDAKLTDTPAKVK